MRRVWPSPNIVGNGVLWLVGVAVQIMGWINPLMGYVLLGMAFIWSVSSVIYWHKHRSEIANKHITKKSLEVSLIGPKLRQYKDNIRGEWFREWYKLQVHNPNALPISDCYGRLIKFTPKVPWPDSPNINMPTPGIMFPWSSFSAGGKLATLGSHDFDSLDILVFDGKILSVVVLDDAAGKRDLTQFNLLPDEYELVIQVGSQSEALPPSDIILKVESYVEKGKEHIRVTIPNQDVDCFTKVK